MKSILVLALLLAATVTTQSMLQADPPAAKVEPGFIDTHVHAFDCRKDGLDVVAAWMERVNVSQCIIHPLDHKGSRPSNEEERQEMLANYRKYKGVSIGFASFIPTK